MYHIGHRLSMRFVCVCIALVSTCQPPDLVRVVMRKSVNTRPLISPPATPDVVYLTRSQQLKKRHGRILSPVALWGILQGYLTTSRHSSPEPAGEGQQSGAPVAWHPGAGAGARRRGRHAAACHAHRAAPFGKPGKVLSVRAEARLAESH